MESIVINIDAELGSGLTRALDILEKLGTVSKKDADAFRALNLAGQQVATGQDKVQSELSQTEQALNKVHASSQKTGASLDNVGKKTGEGVRVANRDLGFLNNAIAGIGSAIAGAFAIQSVIRFADEAVKAFQEAERNALLLRSAVSVNGGLQADFEDLIRQSERLQRITIFSDDSIQNAQTAALQFGLTKDQVKAIIPVVANFASATGQDLRTALDGVLQGVNGMGRGLKIYGVTIDETQTATERLGDISDQLTKKFEGQAEAIGNTATGAAAKYANQIDDLKEKLGKDLAPALQNLQIILLQTTDAFVKASSGPSSFAVELGKLFAGNSFIGQFDRLKNSFKEKFETKSIEDLTKLFQQLSIEQAKLTGSARTEALAKQAAALELLKEKQQQSTKATQEEIEALEKLKNASNLSNTELLKIKKTLESFNNVNLRDEIALIDNIIEKRKKAGEKELQDREKNKAALEALEQKASDRLLAIKAAEVDKVAELEQLKQKELRDLVSAAGAASGADVEPILLEFESTGVTDIEKAVKLLQEAKFSTDEIDKFTSAVLKTNQAFDDLIEKEKLAQAEINIKINIEKVNTEFEEFKQELEDLQTSKEIEIRTKFVQDGDFSSSAFAKMQAEVEALSEKTFDKLIAQAKAYGVDKAVIDDLILAHQEQTSKSSLDVATQEHEEKLALLEREKQVRAEVLDTILNGVSEFLSSLNQINNNRYESQIQQIESIRDKQIEAYDEELQALEDSHRKGNISDRKYESQKQALLDKRQAEEKKADKELSDMKRKQAISNKNFAILTATLKGIEGVARAFADYVFPYSAIVAGIVGGLAVAQVAAASSEPIPEFAKGVEKVTGKGTETSDEVPAKLSVGERVVTAEKNRKYFPILHAIHEGLFAPEVLNKIAKMSPETLKEISKIDTKYLKEISRFDSKTLKEITKSESVFSKISSDTLRVISKTNPDLIREIAMMPDFALKQLAIPDFKLKVPDMNFRLKPPERERQAEKAPETKYVGLTEGDMMYALKQGTKVQNTKELAGEIARQLAALIQDPYAKYGRR